MSDYAIKPYSEDAQPEQLSPEGAKVSNTYLANGCSITETSRALGIPTHEISAVLQSPMVKTYVNSVLREAGAAHIGKIIAKLDILIDRKWEELDEAEIGSNKDIAELLEMSHKMQLAAMKLLQADQEKGSSVVKNTQVNNFGEGNYGKLMEKLIGN